MSKKYLYNPFQDGNSIYDTTLNDIMVNRGHNPSVLKEVLRKISWHETDGTLDPKTKQKGALDKIGGKGLYQFEPASVKTAIQRAKNFYNSIDKEVPKWVTDINTTDATTLPAETQSALAALDMVQRPRFNTREAMESDEGLIKNWGSGWQTESDPKKMKKFEKDLERYEPAFDTTKSEFKVPFLNLREGGTPILNKYLKTPISARGVYDYPKQEVLVPTSGHITMKGVEYAIKGHSLQTGETKIMQPNQEYFFSDTNMVKETPILKDGGLCLKTTRTGKKKLTLNN